MPLALKNVPTTSETQVMEQIEWKMLYLFNFGQIASLRLPYGRNYGPLISRIVRSRRSKPSSVPLTCLEEAVGCCRATRIDVQRSTVTSSASESRRLPTWKIRGCNYHKQADARSFPCSSPVSRRAYQGSMLPWQRDYAPRSSRRGSRSRALQRKCACFGRLPRSVCPHRLHCWLVCRGSSSTTSTPAKAAL